MRPGSGRSFFGEASSSYGVLSGSGLAFGMVSRFARSAGSRSKQKIKNDMAERFGAHAGSDFFKLRFFWLVLGSASGESAPWEILGCSWGASATRLWRTRPGRGLGEFPRAKLCCGLRAICQKSAFLFVSFFNFAWARSANRNRGRAQRERERQRETKGTERRALGGVRTVLPSPGPFSFDFFIFIEFFFVRSARPLPKFKSCLPS